MDRSPARRLLVTGAGSAVGHYVTQIAKARGARVIGTASEAKADHARSAGADFVIDYKQKDVAKVTKELTRGDGVDGIIDMDLSTDGRADRRGVVRPHGTIVCYGSNIAGDIPHLVSSDAVEQLCAQGVPRLRAEAGRSPRRNPGAARHCSRTACSSIAIGARFRLRDIAAAHEAVEGGKVVGNVVLDIGRSQLEAAAKQQCRPTARHRRRASPGRKFRAIVRRYTFHMRLISAFPAR